MSLYPGDSPSNPNGHMDNAPGAIPGIAAAPAVTGPRKWLGALAAWLEDTFGIRREGGGAMWLALALVILVPGGLLLAFILLRKRK